MFVRTDPIPIQYLRIPFFSHKRDDARFITSWDSRLPFSIWFNMSSNFVLVARFRIDVPGIVFTYSISLLSWGWSRLEFLMFSLISSVSSFDIVYSIGSIDFNCVSNYITGCLKAGSFLIRLIYCWHCVIFFHVSQAYSCPIKLFHHVCRSSHTFRVWMF